MSISEDQKSINLPPDSFHWFISRNGQQEGPMVNAEFQKLVGLGHLAPTDFVWRNGMENWVPASEVVPPKEVLVHTDALTDAHHTEKTSHPVPMGTAVKNNAHSKELKKQQKKKVNRYVRAHEKSYGLAIVLAVLFGPLGLFYVGIGLGFAVTIIELFTLFNIPDSSEESIA